MASLNELVIVSLVFSSVAPLRGHFVHVHQRPEIEFEELSSLLSTWSVLLMDVRNRTELRDEGQIVGSVNVPLHELVAAFNPFVTTHWRFLAKYGFVRPSIRDAFVVSCRSGTRTIAAVGILREKFGYTNLRAYLGSFDDWVANKGAIFYPDLDVDYQHL